MEEVKINQKKKKPHPIKRANLLSKIFFCWLPPFLVKGLRRDLDEDDMYVTRNSQKSDILGGRLREVWLKEIKKPNPSLMWAIFKVFRTEFIISGFFNAFIDFIKIGQPVLISQLVGYFQADAKDVTRNQIYLSAFLLVFVSLLQILSIHNYQLMVMTLGMKIRVASCALIYRKSLKLSKAALAETTIGQMVNLLSNDVGRFDFTCQHIHNLWMAPCDTVIVMVMLYLYVGPTGLVGCVFLLSFIPFQMYMAKLTSQFRLKTAIRTDERVRLMNEIISGIQIIKMYTWEKPFAKLVEFVRKKEIDQIQYTTTIRAIMLSFNMTMSRSAIFLCVLTYVVSGNTLTATYAFTITSFYGFLRLTVTQLFPQAIIQFAETKVSISRIQQFLQYEELEQNKEINGKINEIMDNGNVNKFKFTKEDGLNGIYKSISLKNITENKLIEKLVNGYDEPKNEINLKERIVSENVLSDINEEHSAGENDSNKEGEGSENEDDVETPVAKTLDHKEVGIKIKYASVKWLRTLPDNTLEDISFEAKSNQLVAVVGPVGGGKSTLLHVILKELAVLHGTITVNGSVSYASQEPWIFGGSIRQNILFGQEYEDDRYEQAIRVCALDRDFALLPHGDRTLVGERGVTLSGGQRARVNLARAIYKESDIYLLDDPLSAVDTNVGKQLFKKCISRYLKNKCVVLVTHQLQFLRKANWIYVLEDGKIQASGTYQNLSNSNSAFTRLLESSKEEEKREEGRKMSRTESVHSELEAFGFEEVIELKKEERASGKVAARVYGSYVKAGGNWCKTVFLAIGFISAQLFGSVGDMFLSTWVNVEQVKSKRNITDVQLYMTNISYPSFENDKETFWSRILTDEMALSIYSILVISTVILAIIRSLAFFRYCLRASTKLHNIMFRKIVYSPMLFFNTNPTGRILNRFSKDIGALDETLPICVVDTLGIGLIVTGTILVITSVNPWMLLPTCVILIIFYFIRKVFLASSRDIKRVEAVTRSPIFTHLAASLQGLTTIRSFNAQEILTKEFDHYQDEYTSAFWMFLTANRGFGFWLDLHCILFIALVIISILFVQSESYGGDVGLALTQAVTLSGMFQWGMRQWSELENQMTSVERVQEYADLPKEVDEEKRDPPVNWPSKGRVSFRNMSLKYSEDGEYVLKNLNFEIEPNEKIGIVGRTGAGKTSLIQALFRLAYIDGGIFIDGVDSKIIELSILRSKLSIIPQEPVLFSGTLRKNLDPFDEYTDKILWSALEEVELKHPVEELSDGLYGKMAESGSNFSVGQRQLVCLARAIVRNNKILVLDEATANVDPLTDAIIQTTIRKKFANCTVLTIAHRLNTIMDSDRVLVMDAGEAVEFDHPYTLLEKKGVFHGLVKQTGSTMAANLKAIAEESFLNRRPK